MTEVAQATVTIIPNMKGAQEKIAKDLGASAGDSGEKAGKSFGSRMIGALGKLGAAAAVTKVIKDSIGEGAKLQQSLGGIETLFKDNADTVKDYASKAYKTAGLSANEYMENVTSFSAALIKSMGGDTAAAAETANMAMIDMADNANKMGTPIESIQQAYQGFAKGQYQLLDNLKLGYGGTKTEMERLLADASKLSGVEYNIDNLDDVYEAIHVIQEDLDITGTTAKEAASTFSGSFASMKAAATNLMGSMAIGKPIWDELDALSDSVKTFLVDNLLPMIGNVVAQLPHILAYLPGMLADMLPDLFAGGVDIVDSLIHSILDNAPVFVEGMIELFKSIPKAIMGVDWAGLADGLLGALSASLYNIWDEITELLRVEFGIDLPDWDTVVQNIADLWENVKAGIVDFFKAAFDIITDDDKTITEKLSALWELVKGGIVDLFKGYFEIVLPAFETIVSAISDWWGTNIWPAIQDFFQATFGIDLPDWNSIVEPIRQGWETIKAGIATFFKSPFDVELPTAEDVINAIDKLWTDIWNGITGWFNATFGLEIPTWEEVKESISQFWQDIYAGIADWFKTTFNITIPSWSDIQTSVTNLWNDFKEGIAGFFQKTFGVRMPTWSDIQKKIEDGWETVKQGIGNIFSWLFSLKFPSIDDVVKDLKDWWGGVVKGIGDFFTLKWFFDKKSTEEALEEFGGGGRKFELGDDTVSIDSKAIQDALSNANLTLADIDTSSIDKAKEAVTNAVTAMQTAFSTSNLALSRIKTETLTTAKTAVNNAVVSIKGAMKFSWSLPTLHGHLPVISVDMKTASSSDGKTKVNYPDLYVSRLKWFAQGGIFNEPTVIGIGDSKGPEAAVPLDEMWKRMRSEFDRHSGATVTNYFTVDGAQNPEQWAMEAARTIKRELRMA